MAGIASLACECIIIHIAVFIRKVGLVIMLMAIDTAEGGIISCNGMAFTAGVPYPPVPSAVNREILPVMIKCRWLPAVHRMTILTIRREKCRTVVRVDGIVVILLMAPRTGIGCIAVIPVMAKGTIVGNDGMCPVKRIEVIMIVKRCRCPVRICGMA
jgi:hypothetical protein